MSDEIAIFLIHGGNGGYVFPGDDEDVNGGLRLNIFEGHRLVVFIKTFGGGVIRRYLAENTVLNHRATPFPCSSDRRRRPPARHLRPPRPANKAQYPGIAIVA